MKEKSILALKLKQLRREKNVTSEEVANAVGIKPATYRRYEIDTNPKRETFVKLAEYFEVSIDYLVGNEEAFSFRTESPNLLPPTAAIMGRSAWRKLESSPTRISRLISSPIVKKNTAQHSC